MFGKLKDKLKSALSVFSRKAEEEAEVVEEVVEKEVPEVKTRTTKKEVKTKVPASQKTSEKKKEAKATKEVSSEKVPSEKLGEQIPEDQVKITYFVHGTTKDNEEGRATGWEPGELSALGKKQCQQLRDKLDRNIFDAVFSSDLKRAVDSAKIMFQGAKVIQDKRLREAHYGDFTLAKSDSFKSKLVEYVERRFPKGESYGEVERRIAEFLNEIYDTYKGKHIAIVAHQAPQLALDVLLNGKSWEEAINEDWREQTPKGWKPGWGYILSGKIRVREVPPEKKGFFSKIKESLTKKEPEVKEEVKAEVVKKPVEQEEEQKGFLGRVKETLTTKKISAEKFEELFWDLELALLENNVSVEVIEKIKADLKFELVDKTLPRKVEEKILATLKQTLSEILSIEPLNLLARIEEKKPFIIAFFGINGAGKTTSIAKLTHYLQQQHKTVVLAACDTFRAAAIQQLEEHAQKLQVKMIKHDYGSDAAAVAFDAIKYAEKNNIDVVLIDTAGRLHSNTNLMSELGKIIRVTKPDLNIFVGESITGNDCIEQARQFNDLVRLDGVILTKADVDEKGGAPLSIAYTIKKPILFLGMGQKYEDLEPFNADVILGRLGL